MPRQGPGFYNKIMAGRPVALLAALVNIAVTVGKYFRSKEKKKVIISLILSGLM